MTKNGTTSDFVREAIREKAARELSAINQRADAFSGIERTRDGLFKLSNELVTTSAAISQIASDNAVSSKLKKLRKLVEEAHMLATELSDTLGVESHREALSETRQSILDALKSVGIDPQVLLTTTVGDAQ